MRRHSRIVHGRTRQAPPDSQVDDDLKLGIERRSVGLEACYCARPLCAGAVYLAVHIPVPDMGRHHVLPLEDVRGQRMIFEMQQRTI